MDLNHVYCIQQRALMRAAGSLDPATQHRHQSLADRCAQHIARFQHRVDAGIARIAQRSPR